MKKKYNYIFPTIPLYLFISQCFGWNTVVHLQAVCLSNKTIYKDTLDEIWVTRWRVKKKLNQYNAISMLYPVINSHRDLVSASFKHVYNFFKKKSWLRKQHFVKMFEWGVWMTSTTTDHSI